jgi:hypothetical protein
VNKKEPMAIAKGACPYCGGDVCTSYKYGALCKCLKCHCVMPHWKLVKTEDRTNENICIPH